MIKINRGPEPEFFDTERYRHFRNELWEYFADYNTEKRQTSFSFEMVQYLRKEIMDELVARFHGKCSFCETPLDTSTYPELEHFRPKRGARGFSEQAVKVSEGSYYYDTHYWWLALEWTNLLLICPECNRGKANWFPLVDESMRAPIPSTPEEALSVLRNEEPLLLDPCGETDPDDHLRFEEDGRVVPLSEKGKATISLLNLNRESLVHARRDVLENLIDELQMRAREESAQAESVVERLLQDRVALSTQGEAVPPYLAIQLQYLKRLYERSEQFEAAPAEALGDELERAASWSESVSTPIQYLDLGRIHIQRIRLHNFKNIADIDIEVPVTSGSHSPWLVFLGENAVGKSTILQAIVLTLMGDQQRGELPDLKPQEFLRYYREGDTIKHTDEGYVEIWVDNSEEPLRLSFNSQDDFFHSNVPAPRAYLMAYGPTRLQPEPDQPPYQSDGMVRVRNLFRPSTPLVDARDWLYNLYERDPQVFDMMVRGLRDMLLMKGEETIAPDLAHPNQRRILVHLKNETTEINKLSDGYRSVVALAVDLMSMLVREGTAMEDAEGVVLIDEIGTNLHPAWKKRIVGCIRNVFPRLQFIGTTHEPLCLRGLLQGETVLLRRDFDDKVVPITNLPNPNDLRIDELLTSEFFGLNSTLDTDLEDLYEEYYRLLNETSLDEQQKQRKAELKQELRDRTHLGTGLRDELMYEVIDKLLAQHLKSPQPMDRQQLKKETLLRVLDSWKKAGLIEP